MGGAGGGAGGGGAAWRRQRMSPEEAANQKIDWTMVRGIFRLAQPFRRSLLFFGLASIASALVGTMPALVFKAIIDNAIKRRDVHLLVVLSMAAIGLVVARSMFVLLQRWQASTVGAGITYTMRTRLYDHIQRMPLSFFTATQTGALMSRINNDVIGAERVLTGIVSTLTTNTFTFISTIGVMFALDWRLTLVVLMALPMFIIPSKYMGRVLQKLTRERFDLLATMNAFLHERLSVSGAMLNHLFGNEVTEQDDYEERAVAVRNIGTRTALTAGTFTLVTSMFATMSTAIVYWVGGWRAITGGLTVGTVVAFGQLASRAYQPVSSMSNTRIDLMTAVVSFERVFEVLNFPNPITDRAGAVDLVDPGGRVEFDHVSFAYPPAAEVTLDSLQNPGVVERRAGRNPTAAVEVLHDIDFVAEPGQMVAFVGPTGAGKSTTLNLVSRLYDVSDGAVRVDGHDVRDLTLASLRRAIGVVSQDSHLFHDTLRANLLYAKPDASQDEVETACQVARIHDLIASLPEGYDTVAGERGYRMSGGEKQRLAIARMILKNPTIVILDEATAHLDSTNERLIQEALAEALVGRTTLVIAHRLSTIVRADQIVVIDAGRAVQRGTHDELVAIAGLYQTLYQTQFESAVPGGAKAVAS